MAQQLCIWTIYKNPSDFPGKFVARRFEGDKPTNDHYANENVDTVRKWIHKDAGNRGQGSPHRLERQPNDDPVILESWV